MAARGQGIRACHSTVAGASGNCSRARGRQSDREPCATDLRALLADDHRRRQSAEKGSVDIGRRRSRRSGAAHVARRARAAIGRRDSVRRSGLAGNPRFRAPRGQENAGRQDRLRPVLQAGRDQRLMIALAKTGRRVVRLKGGDPMIFGRAGEEIEACRNAGIAVEIVPGISAAQGAAGRLGISLTHRRHARRLQYLTGIARTVSSGGSQLAKFGRSVRYNRHLYAGQDARFVHSKSDRGRVGSHHPGDCCIGSNAARRTMDIGVDWQSARGPIDGEVARTCLGVDRREFATAIDFRRPMAAMGK